MSEHSKYEPTYEGHYQQACDRLAEYEGGDTVPRSDYARLQAEVSRLKEERALVLTVKTKEGLTASEWVLRTAKAEAEVERLKELNRNMEIQLVDLSMWCNNTIGINTNAVIGTPGWPPSVGEVIIQAVEEKLYLTTERVVMLENELSVAKDQIPSDMEGDSLSVALIKLKDIRRFATELEPKTPENLP